ncbi:AIS_HP2_G0028000.mRNA.1.CDS.1 [Saccharomyces cerevisiae]|nr:AIS_HP2_G0028000.mRNA.1.CDS.1 [Saccharomyces cerevisiae]CAI6579417.1 AIS_HP2_G0028000.mRNA.1.CDS.1 [Saccharomyces cerevisiae]CAI6590640.1 AIS_HP1_G0029500.mRNA.1.CDS.1 [Saccharomyces cerevisiae]CAI6744698.1 AIS_collapsed_G0029820.mRNA.1.CDS.1 [Saccharomyces cerevisiae]
MPSTFESQLFFSKPFLSKRQIQRAQKNTISDYRNYNQKKLAVFKFLSDLCVQLKFPRKTLETAVYFYQRYHLFNRFETEVCYTVATSCLTLGCKEVETIKKTNDICTLSLRLRNVVKINTDILENFKKRVFQIELRILESCSFDYRVNNYVHIDEYVIKIGRELSFDYKLCNLAWVIAYDALKLETILVIPQHSIALAILKIAYELLDNKNWSSKRYSLFETDEKSVNEAYFDIVNFYINSFDMCDLQRHLPADLLPIGVERFMELKKNAGPESGLPQIPDHLLNADPYITITRDNNVQERRYVLSLELINGESSINSSTRHA